MGRGVNEVEFVGQAPGRRHGTIMMRDGRYIHPLELRIEDLRIDYMLFGLPNICRFTGSIAGAKWGRWSRRVWRKFYNPTSFYSVAQHQVLGARHLLSIGQWDDARWFIVHDAVEFAMGDVSRPIKYQPEMQFYRDAENEALEKLARRYALPWPMPPAVKYIDNKMLATEVRDLMNDAPWQGLPKPFSFHIEPWLPRRAFREYRDTLEDLAFWPT